MSSAALQRLVLELRHTTDARSLEGFTDTELLDRFLASGDPAAFEVIVRRHGAGVLASCRRVLASEADAEDVFQATFLVLLQGARRIRQQQALGGWLSGVAHRIALKTRSSKARRERAEQGQQPAVDEALDLSWREACAILHEEVDRLPDKYRLPLILCYLEGKSRDEAALQLGVNLGVLRGQLERGRDRLRGRLARRGIALSAGLLAVVTGSVTARPFASSPSQHLIDLTLQAAASARPGAPVLALLHGVSTMITTSKKTAAALVVLLTMAGVLLAWPQLQVPGVGAPPATADKMPARSEKPADAKPVEKPMATLTVFGKVLGPDGKPVAGAKLFVPALKRTRPVRDQDVEVRSIGASGPDGRFRVPLSALGERRRCHLIAHAPGLGVDWLECAMPDKATVEDYLRLVKDVPISGRVISTEGKPVPGVSVSAVTIYVPPDEKLDDYLAGWKKNLRDNMSTPRKRLYLPLDRISGSASTDKDGRFTVRGAGAERIVVLRFTGAGIARSIPWVVTRPGFDPKPYNDVLLSKDHEDLRVLNRFLGLNGPDLTFIAEGGKEISGVVTDAATGKPVPGCTLSVLTGFSDGVDAQSDAQGRYRLTGLPRKNRGYGVHLTPPEGKGYLSTSMHAKDTDGFTPVRLDVRVVKGSYVVGRVIDRQTGKGVQAGVRFAPLPDNKFFGTKPEYNSYNSDRTMRGTDADGRFRLSTIPGRALVMVQAHGGQKFNGEHLCPYRHAVPEPEHKSLFTYDKDDDSYTITTAGPSLEILSVENAVKVIDVKEQGETRVDLYLDRGATGQVAVQGADGKALAGAWVAGLTQHWPITYKLPEATATVYALNPTLPRTLVVYHPAKQLGGTVVIRGDEKEPVVAKLGPLASVTGRLLEADGLPLAGATVSVAAQGITGREMYRIAQPSGKPVLTDKQGRFTLAGVVPGMAFYVQSRKGEHYYGGKPKIGLRKLKPGETLALGDRTMERLR